MIKHASSSAFRTSTLQLLANPYPELCIKVITFTKLVLIPWVSSRYGRHEKLISDSRVICVVKEMKSPGFNPKTWVHDN